MNTQKAKWIWYRGDYEIYHSLLLHARREEYGIVHPCMWTLSNVYPRVNFHKSFTAPEDTVIHVHTNAPAAVVIDGKYHPVREDIALSKGEHRITVKLLKPAGLPSIYINSQYLVTDSTWRADCMAHGTDVWAGDSPAYYNAEDNPEEFVFSYERVDYATKEALRDGILFDFSRELFAKLVIENADKDMPIEVYYGESAEEALAKKDAILYETVAGKSEYTLVSRAFRYIYIESESAERLKLHALYEYLPLDDIASFECDRELVKKVYDVSAYTFHLNSREFFLDGIKRDRWVWSGDAYQSFMINQYLFFDRDITRRTITALLGKPPYISHINTINDYSYYMMIALYDYYFATGDKDFVEFIFPRVRALYDFSVSRLDSGGLVCGRDGDWIFIDWSDMDKDGPIAAEQIVLWQAANCMAKLADVLGFPSEEYTSFAHSLKEKVMQLFWSDEKGAFIDCAASGKNYVTRHANIFAILYDFVDDEKKELIRQNVLNNPEITQITTPYFNFYQLMARCKLGDIEFMQAQIEEYWGGMIALGATSIWEEYNPLASGVDHYAMYGKRFGKSLCHAWGSGPVYLLGRYCLGVTPTDVAYKSFCISPKLGVYKHIKGSVPLPDGRVDVTLDGDTLTVMSTAEGGYIMHGGERIDIPANEAVTVKYK